MHPLSAIALLFCLSCTQKAPDVAGSLRTATAGDSIPPPHFSLPSHDYAASRAAVKKHRQALRAAYAAERVSIDSVGKAFTQCLLTEIFPHWYGTHWTFSGHTETPGQGDIACGYFVSTTLLHTGLNLNRYRLAQQSPADEALMLSLGDTISLTQRDTAAKALQLWRTRLRDGRYFSGLGGGHVGFLWKQGTGLHLIHSNYAGPVEVQMQRAEESVLMGFQDFYLADITFNQRLMEYWLSGEKMPLHNRGVLVRW